MDRGFTTGDEYAEQAMKELPYDRQYDPEASVRLFALRLHGAGMVKGSPQKLIADGTDWRFLRDLRKALEA